MISVSLNPDELICLDGKCRPEIQAKVDEARTAITLRESGLPEKEALMVAKIAATAVKEGRLTYQAVSISRCPCCGRDDGYWPVMRRTKYKRRGEKDYDNPKRFTGYDLDRGCVVMRSTIFTGFCDQCAVRVKPVLAKILEGVNAAVPREITGTPPQFKRFDNRKCTVCGWTGHEGQLGKLRTLMGDGYYPGQCPQCGAKNEFLSHKIDIAPGFTLVPIVEGAVAPTHIDALCNSENLEVQSEG